MKTILTLFFCATLASAADVEWRSYGRGQPAFAESWTPANAPRPDASLAGKDIEWNGSAWVVKDTAYPSPSVIAPVIGTNGTVVGTARLLVDSQNNSLVVVIDSASPQRGWSVQLAEFNQKRVNPPASTKDVDSAIVAIVEAYNAKLPANQRVDTNTVLQAAKDKRSR